MSQRAEAERREAEEDLSALMDGELDASAVAGACRAWREDAQLRSQWHVHHLIGDVMRSEDLVSDANRDAQFLSALRTRLAEEPVVLAPSGVAAPMAGRPNRTRRSWMAPAAVAAGFAVVAGTLVVTQMAGGLSSRDPGADRSVAQAPSSMQTVSLGDKPASATGEQGVVLNGQLVRDARLDEYLAAHKKFGGSSLPGGPSGFLRNASVEVPAR